MENINDRIEEMTLLQFNESEQRKLEQKFKDRTQVQAFEGFIKGCKASRTILQSFSFILGFGFALMMTIKMPTISMFIFSLCLTVLVLIEFAKRWTLDKYFEVQIVNKSKAFPISTRSIKLAIFSLICISATLSFVGSPYVIEFFAKHEPLISLNAIELQQDSLIQKDTMVWSIKKQSLISSANAFLMTNGKKDSHTKKWRIRSNSSKTFNKMQNDVQDIENTINSVLLAGINKKNIELEKAQAKNDLTIQHFKEWCSKFGWFGSFAAIAIDIIIIILSFVISGHEERKYKENHSRRLILDSLQENEPKNKEQRTFKEKIKKQEAVFQEVKRKSIQEVFASSKENSKEKEGSFIQENGKRKVLLWMTKGKNKDSLQSKSKADIKNAISNQSNQKSERTLFLKDLLKQF